MAMRPRHQVGGKTRWIAVLVYPIPSFFTWFLLLFYFYEHHDQGRRNGRNGLDEMDILLQGKAVPLLILLWGGKGGVTLPPFVANIPFFDTSTHIQETGEKRIENTLNQTPDFH